MDLQAEAFSFTIDEDRQRYLELLDGKLLLVTNTDAPAAEVVQRYKSLADIERGFRVLKSDIEIGPVYHRLPKRIRAHAHSRWAGAPRIDRNDTSAEVAVHRASTACTHARRTLPARFVVCAFDPRFKQINDLRAQSVEFGLLVRGHQPLAG